VGVEGFAQFRKFLRLKNENGHILNRGGAYHEARRLVFWATQVRNRSCGGVAPMMTGSPAHSALDN
jgi:hypothetical protein